jgi:hypothetical protein
MIPFEARWQGFPFLVDVVGWVAVERSSYKIDVNIELGNKGLPRALSLGAVLMLGQLTADGTVVPGRSGRVGSLLN